MGYKEDVRCLSGEPYSCLNCSATYLPCGGDCKPFKEKSEINIAGKKKWLNCCSYCIKTRSCAKVENEYLKSIRYNGPHYLKTGKECVVNIENKFLKDKEYKKKALKQACDKFKSTTQTQMKLKKEQLVEPQETVKQRKRDESVQKREKNCEELNPAATEMRQKKEYKEKLQKLEKIRKKEETKMETEIENTVQNKECEKDKQKMDKLEKKQEKLDKKKQQMIEKIQKKLEKQYKQQKKKIQRMQEDNVNSHEECALKYYKKFEKNLQECKAKKETKNIFKVNRNTDYKLEKETNDDTKGKIKDACHLGVCANSATNKKVKFICKCKKRRLFTPQCKNTTCVGVIPSPIEGTLNKLSCVCKKVSTKLLGNHQVCQGGQCQRAKNCNRDFWCKCLPQVTCVTNTCGKNTKFKELAQAVHAKCKCGLKCKKIILQDQIVQTGEPVFEVQVRRGGLEIANLEEVQQNVKSLGKTRISCTCPMFNKHLQHSIKNVCATGACRKDLSSKSISINLIKNKKCESRKSRLCTEKASDLKANLNILARSSRIIDPLFSLNVNTDKNTILNADEIQKRISNYQNKHKFCKIGRCHDAFNKSEMDFTCECRPMSDICTDKTCDCRIYVKEMDKKNKLESVKHKGESNYRIEPRPTQGVSVPVARKEKVYRDCDADNCHCPRRSRLACISHFPLKQEKQMNKTLNSADDGAYCCVMCQESNPTTNKEQNEKYLEEEEILQKKRGRAKATVMKEVPTKQSIKETEAKVMIKEADYLTKEKTTTKSKATMKEKAKSTLKRTVEEKEKDLAKRNKKDEFEEWENEEKIRIEKHMIEGNVSLISSCLSGLVSWIVAIISKLIHIIYLCVRHPKLAFAYTQEKLRNPKPTFYMIKRWGFQLYRSKLLRIKYNIARSETATMLTDEILTSKYVKVFLPKDKATNDNLIMRQQRKMKRKKDAIYSCKHVQLLTMRKTPCMWFFYLCPEFYVPFLNFVTGCKTALKVIGAIVVWTPCIVAVEIINCCCCC